jgi:hypothetical protein
MPRNDTIDLSAIPKAEWIQPTAEENLLLNKKVTGFYSMLTRQQRHIACRLEVDELVNTCWVRLTHILTEQREVLCSAEIRRRFIVRVLDNWIRETIREILGQTETVNKQYDHEGKVRVARHRSTRQQCFTDLGLSAA